MSVKLRKGAWRALSPRIRSQMRQNPWLGIAASDTLLTPDPGPRMSKPAGRPKHRSLLEDLGLGAICDVTLGSTLPRIWICQMQVTGTCWRGCVVLGLTGGGVRGVAWDPCETMPSEGGCLEDRQYDGRIGPGAGGACFAVWPSGMMKELGHVHVLVHERSAGSSNKTRWRHVQIERYIASHAAIMNHGSRLCHFCSISKCYFFTFCVSIFFLCTSSLNNIPWISPHAWTLSTFRPHTDLLHSSPCQGPPVIILQACSRPKMPQDM